MQSIFHGVILLSLRLLTRLYKTYSFWRRANARNVSTVETWPSLSTCLIPNFRVQNLGLVSDRKMNSAFCIPFNGFPAPSTLWSSLSRYLFQKSLDLQEKLSIQLTFLPFITSWFKITRAFGQFFLLFSALIRFSTEKNGITFCYSCQNSMPNKLTER